MIHKEYLLAPAKINLDLRIGEKIITSNHHCLKSIFLRLNLTDSLEIILSPRSKSKGVISILSSFDNRLTAHLLKAGTDLTKLKQAIESSSGLISRTIEMVMSKYVVKLSSYDIEVHLNKSIPTEAGLGGGSADAAAILNYLDRCFNLGLHAKLEIASQIGFDVAPCLFNSPSYVSYNGTHSINRLDPKLKSGNLPYILILKPPVGSNTQKAYKELNRDYQLKENLDFEYRIGEVDAILAPFYNQDICKEPITIINDFQNNLFLQIPNLKEEIKHLSDFGPLFQGLSGSGSSIFAIFRNYRSSVKAYNACSNLALNGWFLSLNQILCL